MLNKLHQVLLSFLFNTSRAIQKVQVSLLACRYAYGFRIRYSILLFRTINSLRHQSVDGNLTHIRNVPPATKAGETNSPSPEGTVNLRGR